MRAFLVVIRSSLRPAATKSLLLLSYVHVESIFSSNSRSPVPDSGIFFLVNRLGLGDPISAGLSLGLDDSSIAEISTVPRHGFDQSAEWSALRCNQEGLRTKPKYV